MASPTSQFLQGARANNEPFLNNCICCRKNFDMFRMVLMREQIRAQIPDPIPSEDLIIVFSRPEILPCFECEQLKQRYLQILIHWYEIRKDNEGFIVLTCKPHAGLYLLKGTSVLNHFFTPEQQEVIKLRF